MDTSWIYFLLAVVSTVTGVIVLFAGRRPATGDRRPATGDRRPATSSLYCAKCGYDLRETLRVFNRCPECGWEIQSRHIVSGAPPHFLGRNVIISFVLILISFVLLLTAFN